MKSFEKNICKDVSSKVGKTAELIARSIFFCILMYQFSELTQLYLNFNTIVNTKVEKIKFNQLPAITVCYPVFISNEKIKEECEEIIDLLLRFGQLKPKLKNSTNQLKEYDMKAYLKKRDHLLVLIDNASTQCENKIYRKPALELSTYGMTFGMKRKKLKLLVEAKAYGRIYDKFNRSITYSEIQDMNPIESFTAIDDERPKKCFTLFSKFNVKRDKFIMDLSHFEIQIRFNDSILVNRTVYPYPNDLKDYHIYFSLHSPSALPQLTEVNYIKLTQNRQYKISFSRIVTRLLPSPFVTNCREYDILNNEKAQTKSDCIDRCLIKFMEEKCGNCLHRIGILFRSEVIAKSQILCQNSSQSEECVRSLNSEIRPKCDTQCNNDCVQQFFEYNINSDYFPPPKYAGLSHMDFDERIEFLMESSLLRSKIQIYHKSLPDTIIQHMPEISLTEYIAQLGGLAGMWLGLSAITIYENSVQLILLCFEKFKFQ